MIPQLLIHVSSVNDVHPHVMVGLDSRIHRIGPNDDSILTGRRINKPAIGLKNFQAAIGQVEPSEKKNAALMISNFDIFVGKHGCPIKGIGIATARHVQNKFSIIGRQLHMPVIAQAPGIGDFYIR